MYQIILKYKTFNEMFYRDYFLNSLQTYDWLLGYFLLSIK